MENQKQNKSLFSEQQRLRIIETMGLDDRDILLILSMRKKFRYGTVTIMVRHGRPVYIEQVKQTYDLEAAIRGGDLTEMTEELTVQSS